MKKRWICDFCDARTETQGKMRKHEAACDANPVNRTCQTCRHFRLSRGWERRKKQRCDAQALLVEFTRGCEYHSCISNSVLDGSRLSNAEKEGK